MSRPKRRWKFPRATDSRTKLRLCYACGSRQMTMYFPLLDSGERSIVCSVCWRYPSVITKAA